ncbi:hypothetical protein [Aquipuribacter hungaricus]|uniref:hypothetical protein n=1 Tax=Aquipuribacter hungaricus TaxID=545624 RepID=UPI00361001B5
MAGAGDVVAALAASGGRSTYRRLVAATSRRDVRAAVRARAVEPVGRGRYVLPGADTEIALALGNGGAVSYLTAARVHGWGVVRRPSVPHVTVAQHGHGRTSPRAVLHFADLTDAERDSGVTSPVRTVLDCARSLPFHEGLAVADSALRSGAVLREEIVDAAAAYRGAGARRARAVCHAADERAANAFESALRGHLLVAGVTGFVPQQTITGPGLLMVVDLADVDRRVALEADGYGVHGTRRAFAVDLARHDASRPSAG